MSTASLPTPIPTPQLDRYKVSRLPVRRFSVDEYHRMIDDGYFAADERFELLEGWIVEKVSRNPIHESAVDIAEELLRPLLPPGWYVRGQKAFTTVDSEPEPDVVVVRGAPRDYVHRQPGPADAALVIEVANSSLADDREIKARLYARGGVSVYWIINLINRQIEVYTQPTLRAGVPAYARREDFASGQAVTFSVGNTVVGPVPVADFLP